MDIRRPPCIENAPGLVWKRRATCLEARWQARTDLVARGFTPKSVHLWTSTGDVEPSQIERDYISDLCNRLQSEMLVFGRGGIPVLGTFTGTLKSLIECYQTDADSGYHKLRYGARINHDRLLRRIVARHGHEDVKDIRARVLKAWHEEWSADGKVSMGQFFIGKMRTLFGFGSAFLEDEECTRICQALEKMRFAMGKPRNERMTSEQATAIRRMAHARGLHSVALAQAFQFELTLRQKDVIGEWIPTSEPGVSDITHPSRAIKWLSGLRWSAIDENLILRHTTSKRQKDIQVDLRLAPMVMEELERLGERPTKGPVIVSETTGQPYVATTFRMIWRKVADDAGLPRSVKNMDTRAGAISEATDAGASLEMVRHAATHSNVSTTANYSRGSTEKTAEVMRMRSTHRNKK